MNDTERAQWVDNHEPLYNMKRASGKSMRRFIREHRAEVDAMIKAERDKPPARSHHALITS